LTAKSNTAEMAPHPAHQRLRHYIGRAGLALGIVALALALVPGWVAPLYDPPSKPIPQAAADWLGDLKDKPVAASRLESTPPAVLEVHNAWRDPRIVLASLLLAFAALVLGIVALVRHEDQRLVACTIALSAGALASAHLLTAIMLLAFAVLVGM